MDAYENETSCVLDKTVDDEAVCVCVCVCLRILIVEDKILSIFSCNLQVSNFL
jgi:hypothetical protein